MPLSSKVSGWQDYSPRFYHLGAGSRECLQSRACSVDLFLSLRVRRGVLNLHGVIPCARGEI